ncbi:SDR family NAD(P)-dependent oxidoreductase [Nonlabens ulvanivorans]|uniref:NAD(P)-dependent dehydrogenase (Short-subunit alcohol dehydrogenase family) n=1 Tax=Nonlabens ulvanivorans TaxID=906888 RepID=A0A084JWI5_NONUL|nr:SDR family oxidoreductase [Nonlabens ulvanivorans]KEZ93319.1 oxidoreductase [Nonlabens ulvanivorans]PRX13556.1 NAD(P)-dependent dehydrogenase (short-subunit alcohol dehydrogenase family) [Nonlabens ulvanivorans]
MSKNILLIGGSHGIGNAIVQHMHGDNNLFVASRENENLPDGVTHINFDALTDELDTSSLPEALDGFVYCPGSINLKPFKMLKQQHFEDDMNINFFSMLKVTRAVLPLLTKEGTSSMVYFSTVAVGTGMPFHTSVAAAKGAIEGFAKALAAEYAPTIRVNVIAPSLVDTPLAGRLLNNDAKKEKMGEMHPLKRVGTPDDIASVAAFLLEQNAGWITGQVIGVDGGKGTLNLG